MVVLRKKTWRDLKENKGVYIACAVVIAIGLMVYTSLSILLENLEGAQTNFYSESHFADGFIKLTGCPENKVKSLSALSGVEQIEGRIVKDARILDEQKDSNRYLRMVSLDLANTPKINRLNILTGRMPQDNQPEILVDPMFFAANKLTLGESLTVILEGQRATFSVTGTAQSPEFIYALRTAQDLYTAPEDFGIAYVPLSSLKALVKEKGQVNDIVFTLLNGANFDSVKDSLQTELKRYGLQSIIPRKDQTSNAIITSKITSLRGTTKTLPVVFLGVATIILYTMLRRLIEQQRISIGTLKAFGFTNREIISHYLNYPLVIGTFGGLIGGLSGIALSFPLTTLYQKFFALPGLNSDFSLKYLFFGLALSLFFSLLSGLKGSLDILRLQPAEAMRPPAPVTARKTIIERITWIWQNLSSQAQMGIRNVFRSPTRSLFTVIGIAVVFSLMTVSWSMQNMVDLLTRVQLEDVQTYDLKMQFSHPSSAKATKLALAHERGVIIVEPLLEVPATLKNGWLKKEVAIMGLTKGSTLYNILDNDGQRVEVPEEGILLSEHLANSLNVKTGDSLYIESPWRRDSFGEKGEYLRIRGVVPQYIGLNAFMEDKELQKFLQQGDISNSLLIKMDPSEIGALKSKYRDAINVASIESLKEMGDKIRKMMDSYGFTTWFLAILGGITGFALIYNSSIISLSERQRELASMRVLGFTSKEVLRVITSEQWTLCIFGILLGIPLAYGLEIGMAQALSNDLYSLPAELPLMAIIGAAAGTAFSVWVAQRWTYSKIKSLPFVDILATGD